MNRADQLLAKLKAKRKKPISPYQKGEWIEVFKKSASQQGIRLETNPRGLDGVVESQWKDLKGVLTVEEVRQIGQDFRVGSISSPDLGAFIVRDDKALALIVNWGLMILIHDDLRLSMAARNPENVEFVEGLQRSEISREQLNALSDGLRQNIKDGRGPKAPYVQLSQSAASVHVLTVDMYESFVMAHEIGHILNGDLERDDAFAVSEKFPNVEIFRENVNHAMEFNADRKGFELLLRLTKARNRGLTGEGFALLCVVGLFDLLALTISADESPTHPSPLQRILNVSRQFYGDDFADKMARSYDHPGVIAHLVQEHFTKHS